MKLAALLILVVTFTLKVLLLLLQSPILNEVDELLFLTNIRFLVVASLVAEALLMVILVSNLPSRIMGTALLFVSSQFVLYHLMWYVVGGESHRCPCYGDLWQWMHLSDKTANAIAFASALFLVFAGFWMTRKQNETA